MSEILGRQTPTAVALEYTEITNILKEKIVNKCSLQAPSVSIDLASGL
jgi:hypothetical protein